MADKTMKVVVIGPGTWGTALALHLNRQKHSVCLWGPFEDEVKAIKEQGENPLLPGVKVPDSIHLSSSESDFAGATHFVLVTPSYAFQETLERIKPYVTTKTHVIWATKGVDPNTGALLHLTAQAVLGEVASYAVLSGPSFAKEVALDMPTAVNVAAATETEALHWGQVFHSHFFRVYPSTDFVGVQLGGVVKNVIAIAAGVADGLDFGANTRCALITRGLAEISRLGVAMGAEANTFMGLAGVGDLVLTCTDDQSRNRRFGLLLGQGLTREEAEKTIGQSIEGKYNTQQIRNLAMSLQVDMPIVEQVYQVLYEDTKPLEAVEALMSREPNFGPV